jgi:hypothetical protein
MLCVDLPDLESKPSEEPATANGEAETVGMEDSNATD